jgi:Holliday junction resolvasome RuvABC DNA-binding subunit
VVSGERSVVRGERTRTLEEAQTALTMLGFAKPAVEKLLSSGDWKDADGSPMTVEEIIKEGLRRL